MPYRPSKAKRGKMMNLAERKGITVEPSRMRDCVILLDAKGKRLKHPVTDSDVFTVDSALWMLYRLPPTGP